MARKKKKTPTAATGTSSSERSTTSSARSSRAAASPATESEESGEEEKEEAPAPRSRNGGRKRAAAAAPAPEPEPEEVEEESPVAEGEEPAEEPEPDATEDAEVEAEADDWQSEEEEESEDEPEDWGDEEATEESAAEPEAEESAEEEEPAAASASPARALPKRARIARAVRPATGGLAERRSRRDAGGDDDRRPRILTEDPTGNAADDADERGFLARLGFGGGPSLSAMAAYTRKLSTLITAGIPLVRSLKVLAERTQHPQLRDATKEVVRDVEAGSTLSDALQKHPKIFNRLVISVVQIGEVGGILEESLRRLSEILERKSRVRKQVVAAVSYPVVLSLLSILAVVIIMVTVVPVFETSYKEVGGELPGPTQAMIDLSRHLTSFWLLDLIILVGFLVLIRFYTTVSPTGRRVWERLCLRLYAIGPIFRLVNSARFCRTLGGLLAAGIPLWESLGVAAETSESALVNDAIDKVRDSVEKGQKLEVTIRETDCFTAEMLDIVAIGEESGMLDKMMLSVADNYEEEVQARLGALIELLKPFLLIVVGGCIVAILVAVYLPYFNMIQNIGVD